MQASPTVVEPAGEVASDGEAPLQPLPEDRRDASAASRSWDAGVEAYTEGRLDDAIAAFEDTFRHSGRPGPLFSLGQAHRHRWEDDRDHRQRRLAIARYRQYVAAEPDGRRRAEAERHIATLGLFDELEDPGGEPRVFTRLSVSSPVPGATASIDGSVPRRLPVTPDVAPGRHEVVVRAPGHHPVRREVEVPEGSTVPIEATPPAIDASLAVDGPAGADVYVDGARVARLPTRRPIALPPGSHQIGVAQRGRELYVRQLELGNDEHRRLDVELPATGQRKVAYAAMIAGASASAGSLALMGVALDAQRRGKAIEAEAVKPLHRYEEQLAFERRRDLFRTAAIAVGLSGAALLVTGVVLYFVDRPPVGSRLHPSGSRSARRHGRIWPRFALAPGGTG